jgi:NADH-quinone oxidoreductase subunit L
MNEAFSMTDLIWLVPTLPLVGFVVNTLLGRRLSRRWVGLVACGTVGVAAALSLALAFHLTGLLERQLHQELFTWIGVGEFNVSVSFLLDPLSAVMILVVTWIGFLIHIYSVGYMGEDRNYSRFFAYLNLFAFFMLLLVLADNFLLLFVGWEGVGLCSYLLIGFWFERPAAAAAAEKAFVVNRVGDAGFLVGIFLLYTTFGTLTYAEIFHQAEGLHGQLTEPALGGLSLVTWITLALFFGAIGKSAQLPLYVWLPDAMEGPTPVSALIHAATMVTAGVYMVARSSPLYNLAPTTLGLVATVGAITAIFAATIACVQNDIKRVIAYSTISQLGYMFLGAGVGAYASGIFHLYTHAFFKALLFLGAGAVIHALHHEQDIQRMGGLRPHMKVTAYTFLAGALANAGIFPLAGFWSKDEILFAAFSGRVQRGALRALGAGAGGGVPDRLLHGPAVLPYLRRPIPGGSPSRGARARRPADDGGSADGVGVGLGGGGFPGGLSTRTGPVSSISGPGVCAWGGGARGDVDAGVAAGGALSTCGGGRDRCGVPSVPQVAGPTGALG